MCKRKLCILYVSHSAQLYGAERSLLQLLRGLDRDRFSPVVVLPQEGPLRQEIVDLGIPVEVVSSIKSWLTRRSGIIRLLHHIGLVPFLVRSVWVLMRLINRYHVDLIHTNSLVVIDGALAARLLRIPHIWHAREVLACGSPYHFLFGRFGRSVALSLINHLSDYVIAISSAVRSSLSLTDGVCKFFIVYNAVDEGTFDSSLHRATTRQKLDVPDDTYLVGEVARLTPVKGYEDFVKAAAMVHQVVPNTRFVAVGDALRASYGQRISELIAGLGMERSFSLLGFRQDVAEIIAALDLLVLPSHYEPFGRALIEAMAAGKPVVGTNVGGIPEIIEDGVTGLLVAPGSPDELAGAITKILQNPDLARHMGAAGRERAKAHFSPERYVTEIQNVYEELVGQEWARDH
jgi:glycosyltransferase involved in cell wall biosynthesis